jgi:hypothetical protein
VMDRRFRWRNRCRSGSVRGRSGTELCSTLVGVALQILAGGLTVTGAHAAEAAEALYPGRYVATCKPRARFWLCLRDRFSRTGAVQRIQP